MSPMGRTSFRRLLWPLAAALDGWHVCAGRRVHFRNHARLWHRKVFSIPLQKSAAIPLSAQEQMKTLKSVSWHPLGVDPPAAVPCARGVRVKLSQARLSSSYFPSESFFLSEGFK